MVGGTNVFSLPLSSSQRQRIRTCIGNIRWWACSIGLRLASVGGLKSACARLLFQTVASGVDSCLKPLRKLTTQPAQVALLVDFGHCRMHSLGPLLDRLLPRQRSRLGLLQLRTKQGNSSFMKQKIRHVWSLWFCIRTPQGSAGRAKNETCLAKQQNGHIVKAA